ncbi:MAG: ABC transporter permease [Stackebrandtia sp.]
MVATEPKPAGATRRDFREFYMRLRWVWWLGLWAVAFAALRFVLELPAVSSVVFSLGISVIAWWGEYFAMRVLRAYFVVYVVATGVFFMLRGLPGNPVDVYIARLTAEGIPYEEAAASAAAFYSFDPDAPLWQQYLDYLWGLVNGDFGNTLSRITVLEKIGHHLPWTLFSVGLALLISVAVGLVLGMIMAYLRGGIFDQVTSAIGSVLHSIPNYLLAFIIVSIGGVQLGLFSYHEMRGTYTSGVQPGFNMEFIQDAMFHATLPVLTYVLATVGTWALIMKASTTQALGEDYVTVARARGLGGGRVGSMYVGRNAVLPLVAQIATQAGFVVGGAIFVEKIFSYNGIGVTLYGAVADRDYALVQGILLIITITVVTANLLADLSYGLLDPRIRTSGKEATG